MKMKWRRKNDLLWFKKELPCVLWWVNLMKNTSAKWDMILRNAVSYGASFVFPLVTEVMETPKKVCIWTSGSANSSRARYLDKAKPKEEANFCDLFIKSYFLSDPCVSWWLCFACNIRQHKNAGTFFLALVAFSFSVIMLSPSKP